MLTKTYLSVVLTLLAGPLSAATIIEHMGNNDPTTETPAWTWSGTTITTGPGSEGGLDYWQVNDDSNQVEGFYRYVPSDSELTHAWRYTGIFRVESIDINDPRMGLNFLDGSSYLRINIDTFGQVVYQDAASITQAYLVPGDFDPFNYYNQYAMTMTPTTPGMYSATDVFKFYLNGMLQQTFARSDFRAHTAKAFSWGSSSSGSHADMRFNLVGFYDSDAPPPPFTPVFVPDLPPLVPGDFDGDGDVDGADFVAWQTHFPTSSGAALADGDADGDGDVDGADFVVWQTNFPFTPGAGIGSVPEPTSLVIAVIGGLMGLVWQRQRR